MFPALYDRLVQQRITESSPSRFQSRHSACPECKRDDWCGEFIAKCELEFSKEGPKWDAEWLELCDGKRFSNDLYSNPKIKMNIKPLKFKRFIIERMEREQRDGWVLVEKLISDALRP